VCTKLVTAQTAKIRKESIHAKAAEQDAKIIPPRMRLTERLFRGLRRITMNKKALNPPTISEIVTRGFILAIREREKLDKKAG
jgi:hypothetical protein